VPFEERRLNRLKQHSHRDLQQSARNAKGTDLFFLTLAAGQDTEETFPFYLQFGPCPMPSRREAEPAPSAIPAEAANETNRGWDHPSFNQEENQTYFRPTRQVSILSGVPAATTRVKEWCLEPPGWFWAGPGQRSPS
jgi:hypothetical protein